MIELAGIRDLRLPTSAGDAVEVSGPDGPAMTVPTFRDAEGVTHVRFRTPVSGTYRVAGDGVDETVEADGQAPAAPIIHRTGRHLEAPDGQAFLWLADTWWYALCGRLEFPELVELAARRKAEGFNVVHVVAGLLPEVYAFDDLGALEGVWPWTPGFEDLEPRWWDAADERIAAIVSAGLVPAIVGGWSYYILDMGRERMERHWREVIARWSALPVVWCIGGEAGLPYYEQVGTPEEAELVAQITANWGSVAHAVHELDPYQSVRTMHPCPAFGHYSSTDLLGGDVSDLDLIWLQTGHADRGAIPSSIGTLERELAASHGLPVINSEVCYEGIASGSEAMLQRFLFWSHMLLGAAGHSYGAQGIWAFLRKQDPGPGIAWGDVTWQEASKLPGARQLGGAAELLRTFDWQTLVPSPDSLSHHAQESRREYPYAARSEDRLVAYFPAASLLPLGIGITTDLLKSTLRNLEAGIWDLVWWNPRAGTTFEEWTVEVGEDGNAELGSSRAVGALPSMEDWVLLAHKWRKAGAQSEPRLTNSQSPSLPGATISG